MVGVIQTFYKYIESDSIEISFMRFLGTLGSSYFPFSLLLGKKIEDNLGLNILFDSWKSANLHGFR